VLEDPAAIAELADYGTDPALQERVQRVKRANKIALARAIRDRLGLFVDTGALFDVQIKRIHEYKRQLLNLIETVALWQAMRSAIGCRASRSSPVRRPRATPWPS
jgi:starch phosphorylase